MTGKDPTPPDWVKVLPATLRSKISNRPNLIKILSNVAWLIGDRLLRMGIGLLITIWVARYLGPGNFGLLNYATALVTLFGVVATLGLQSIVVRELVRKSNENREIIGTSVALQIMGGIVASLLVIGAVNYLRADDPVSKILVAILSFTLILKANDVIRYWFEARILSKFCVWVDNGVFIVMAAIRIMLVLTNAPLIAFAWVTVAEALIASIAIQFVYSRTGGQLSSWRPRISRAKDLLKAGWPLVLSGLAIVVYMRIDQIMLGQMIDNEAVGVYSAAVRLSEAWYFVPAAITASVFPSIIGAKAADESLFERRVQRLYDLMVILALIVAVPVTFLSTYLVTSLFGESYAEAGPVLSVQIWASLFVFLGLASSQWLLAADRQVLMFQRTMLGAIVNIALNFLLIPRFGMMGAAYATLASYAVAGFLFDVLQKDTRLMFCMKLRAINIFRGFRNIWNNGC